MNLQLHLLWHGAAAFWRLIDDIYRLNGWWFFLLEAILIHVSAVVAGQFRILLVGSRGP